MSKLTDSIGKKHRVFNSYGFAGERGNVYIVYNVTEPWKYANWAVYRVGYRTDPEGHYADAFNKTFPLMKGDTHKERKELALQQALEWAGERYGITDWAKTPFGSYMDANFVARRMKELK